MKQYTELSCPFCDTGRISALYFPSAWGEKRSGGNSLGSGKSITKSKEDWVIQSGCNHCNKTNEDVDKELVRKGII